MYFLKVRYLKFIILIFEHLPKKILTSRFMTVNYNDIKPILFKKQVARYT